MLLPPDEAHLWYALPDEATGAAVAECRALLSDEERQRADRFMLDQERRRFVVVHALLRIVMSRYEDVALEGWHFGTSPGGRPEIAHPPSSIHFSISKTCGLVACLVARDREVGLDAEDLGRDVDATGIAGRFFSRSEVADLERLPEAQRRTRFLEYWTLKEAYAKARGIGLDEGLRTVAFDIQSRGVRARFDPRIEERARDWQFVRIRPTGRHLLAACISRGSKPEVTLVTRQWRCARNADRTVDMGRSAA